MTDSMLGRWVEISGRLERETSKNPDNLRELDVLTVKMVPVVLPTPAAAAPARRPPPAPAAEPRPTPGTGGDVCTCTAPTPSLASCRRRRARFQRSDWPGCSCLQPASCFVRSVSGNEVDAADTTPTEGTTAHAVAPSVESADGVRLELETSRRYLRMV